MRPINKIVYLIILCLTMFLIAAIVVICNEHDNVYDYDDTKVEIETTEIPITEEKINVENEPIIEDEQIAEIEPVTETEPTEETETIIITETEPVTEPVTEAEPAFYLTDDERRVVECLVMGESGAEPYDGQILVAQCILNACLKDGLQPSQVKKQYGYYGWHNSPSESVKDAVSAVFDNGYKITDELILYFYAPKYSSGSWHETQKFVIQVGGHKFFAEW